MELRSQNVRTLAPENDPLKMGMGWKVEDLSKPQIRWRAPLVTATPAAPIWTSSSRRLCRQSTTWGPARPAR